MIPEPPPLLTIRRELLNGRVVPFLGAGASLVTRDPTDAEWRVLVDDGQDEWDFPYLPTGKELACYLAEQSSFPEEHGKDELAKVAQYFNTVNGRLLLYSRLDEIFNRDHPFNPLHTYLAKIAKPLLIVTTNYDDLIERAFRAEGRPFDLVVHTTDAFMGDKLLYWQHGAAEPQEVMAADLYIDLNKTTVIYKMHGTVDRQQPDRCQYVITEDDYIDFLARMTTSSAIPLIFGRLFQTRPFLFLGYGLYDWNLRVVLNRIEKQFRRPQDIVSWAIQRDARPLEQKLWEKRGVMVFRRTIEDFVNSLQGGAAAPQRAGAQPADGNSPAGK